MNTNILLLAGAGLLLYSFTRKKKEPVNASAIVEDIQKAYAGIQFPESYNSGSVNSGNIAGGVYPTGIVSYFSNTPVSKQQLPDGNSVIVDSNGNTIASGEFPIVDEDGNIIGYE